LPGSLGGVGVSFASALVAQPVQISGCDHLILFT